MAAADDPIIKELRALDSDLVALCQRIDGGAELSRRLPKKYPPEKVTTASGNRAWELCGMILLQSRRVYEALGIFWLLYEQMLDAQTASNKRVHKGMPLVRISDCFLSLGYPAYAKRYRMLTLCEDALEGGGSVSPDKTGIYFRLVWQQGFPHKELERYATEFFELSMKFPTESFFPEALLQRVDDGWVEVPSASELSVYRVNRAYVSFLIERLGDGTGDALELLAEYLLSCMAGWRTKRHVETRSTDLDIVCAMEGPEVDFRLEFGRHFVCECKDWNRPADFTTIAKFCRVLDSIKARFGILFSKDDISGRGTLRYASLEQLKVFQDRGVVIGC